MGAKELGYGGEHVVVVGDFRVIGHINVIIILLRENKLRSITSKKVWSLRSFELSRFRSLSWSRGNTP